MKKAIKCCLSCILPCGSLDVIRIVHANGRVEEISGSIRASEVMKAYPKHVLKKPTACSSTFDHTIEEHGVKNNTPRIVILPPDAELERGKIYFLIPLPQVPLRRPRRPPQKHQLNADFKKHHQLIGNDDQKIHQNFKMSSTCSSSDDRYLSELLSEEKATMQRERRRGRVGVWRPHLDSICEN